MTERESNDLPEREVDTESADTDEEADVAGRDEVDEASEESFPASDPPSY